MERQLARAGTPTMQDIESIAKDAAVAGWSYVAAAAASQLSACNEQARRETLQALGQLQKDAHADAQNVACTTGGRCSEVPTLMFRAGTGQQGNTRRTLNVFVADGEDSRQSDLRGFVWFHDKLTFSDHPHRAADARFEALKDQLASLERDLMDVTQEVFMTRALQIHHVW